MEKNKCLFHTRRKQLAILFSQLTCHFDWIKRLIIQRNLKAKSLIHERRCDTVQTQQLCSNGGGGKGGGSIVSFFECSELRDKCRDNSSLGRKG